MGKVRAMLRTIRKRKMNCLRRSLVEKRLPSTTEGMTGGKRERGRNGFT